MSAEYIDNGSGGLIGLSAASLNYSSGHVSVPSHFNLSMPQPTWLRSDWLQRYFFAGWGLPEVVPAYIPSTASITVTYQHGNPGAQTTEELTGDTLILDLLPGSLENSLPSSVRFGFDGKIIVDRGGALIADPSPGTGTGTSIGVYDYERSQARINQWVSGASNSPALFALRTRLGNDVCDQWTGRTPARPVASLSFSIRATRPDGTSISATADVSGVIIAAGVKGSINLLTGLWEVKFGQMVDDVSNRDKPWYLAENVVGSQVWQPLPVFVDSIRTDSISVTKTALASTVTGIDESRIGPEGRMPKYRIGDNIALHHTEEIVVSSPTPNATVNLGRTDLDWVWVKDATGKRIPREQFICSETDLADGVMAWAATLNTTAYPTPWRVYHRIWFQDVVGDLDRWGNLVLANKAVNRTFPVGSYLSSLLVAGDIQAKTSVPIFQKVWDGVWSDTLRGDIAEWAYDYLNFPILVTNRGATIKAKIALVIVSTSGGDVRFKCLVQGGPTLTLNSPITADFAPTNPATGEPYFIITGNHSGNSPWGVGQNVGSAFIFELSPSTYPVKFLKTLMPSTPTGESDDFEFEFRCNIDRP